MGSEKVNAAILGSGNIGTDLMYKIKRSPLLELVLVAGIDPQSEGLALARKEGFPTSTEGIRGVLNESRSCKIVFDATSAKTHLAHAEHLRKAGKIAIDLTPAAIGPYVVPAVNLEEHIDAHNVNLITCGGQATIPIVAAIKKAVNVQYAETVSTIASKSAGPGTRANIDEFTQTTKAGVVEIGGAPLGKSIIILNPAEPPIMMRNTIYAVVDEPREEEIIKSVEAMVERIKSYVPGYRLKVPP